MNIATRISHTGSRPSAPVWSGRIFYAYAWSQPTGYLRLPLGAPAQELSEPFTGLYAPYDALREVNPFDAAVETMLMSLSSCCVAATAAIRAGRIMAPLDCVRRSSYSRVEEGDGRKGSRTVTRLGV